LFWIRTDGAQVDVAIVGGGVTGAAAARALAGLAVAPSRAVRVQPNVALTER
jgi:glycine/D-amino acid oxidase-like deaminating enzyme